MERRHSLSWFILCPTQHNKYCDNCSWLLSTAVIHNQLSVVICTCAANKVVHQIKAWRIIIVGGVSHNDTSPHKIYLRLSWNWKDILHRKGEESVTRPSSVPVTWGLGHENRIRLNQFWRADNFRPVSFTVRAWEWVYATNLSRLQRERRERERETSKRTWEEHTVH
jgi:hypothetical protein